MDILIQLKPHKTRFSISDTIKRMFVIVPVMFLYNRALFRFYTSLMTHMFKKMCSLKKTSYQPGNYPEYMYVLCAHEVARDQYFSCLWQRL